MVEFTWLDWFWVAAFLLAMLFSGTLFYRLGKRSESGEVVVVVLDGLEGNTCGQPGKRNMKAVIDRDRDLEPGVTGRD